MNIDKAYISVDENGCATVFNLPYGAWRNLDLVLKNNNSTLNNMTIVFEDMPESSIVRLMKRAKETCELFTVKSVKAWRKLLPECEIY